MVIAKPEWFKRRKYLGWGLFPKTWQGVLYTIFIALVTMALVYLPLNLLYKELIIAAWAVFLFLDVGSAMICIKDEREKVHEAIAERNALWAVLVVAAVGIGYQVSSGAVRNNFSSVDWFLVSAIAAALIVKAISNIWLDRKD